MEMDTKEQEPEFFFAGKTLVKVVMACLAVALFVASQPTHLAPCAHNQAPCQAGAELKPCQPLRVIWNLTTVTGLAK